mmetsp:Transcript_7866/g.1029  ORF Transcript_7866/g.1029 Transcript_7866/m.1029 type:complete len:94 (+) Transcript_7866:1026-1307(+)
MGRLLVSLTVSPNEYPETGVSKASPYREPVFKSFSLKCVIFELKNAKGLGDRVELVLRLGPHYVTSKIANKKVVKNGDESSEVFTWGSAYLGY